MQKLIRDRQIVGGPLVVPGRDGLDLIYFNRLMLGIGETVTIDTRGLETHFVPMTGLVDIRVADVDFDAVGGRNSIWDGPGSSLYCGTARAVTVKSRTKCEVLVAGAVFEGRTAPLRIEREDTQTVEVGSIETHSHRQIVHLLGQKQKGKVGRLLVSELYCSPGCWSGYPPHKHDTDSKEETDHEELYHYRFDPPTGFGAQYLYADNDDGEVLRTRNGDTVLVASGYHPTATSPGHREYIFTILAGRNQRGLIQRFEPRHLHLVDLIPGISDMRDKFR